MSKFFLGFATMFCITIVCIVGNELARAPRPAPASQPLAVDTVAIAMTATQAAMVDSVQVWMKHVGWRVRCYTVLLAKKHWSPGGVNFTVDVDSSKETR